MEKVIITIGLPASGKTTWATQYQKQNNKEGYSSRDSYKVKHIEFDSLFENFKYNRFDKETAVKKIIKDFIQHKYSDEIILDDLFLTNDDIIKALNEVYSYESFEKVEIQYWKPNVEICLWNDKYRRSEDSKITIKNAKVEKPDIEFIKSMLIDEETNEPLSNLDIKLVIHNVEKRPAWKVFADKYDIKLNDVDKMGSKYNSWCLGGSFQNCWGTGGTVNADEQPTTFEVFDALLEKICPNITFLQYKKLYSKSVSIETYDEHDYYGGSTVHAYFECDIEKLYEGLVEIGLISDENEI